MNRTELNAYLTNKETPAVKCSIIIEVQTSEYFPVDFILEGRNYTVDWGDGCISSTFTHKYGKKAYHQIKITGENFISFEIIRNRCYILSLSIHAPTLRNLDCGFNYISKLDISGCKNLQYFSCVANYIRELNLINQSQLIYVNCGINRISYLNLSKCSKLKWLNCNNNAIMLLDLNSLELTYLNCANNDLNTKRLNYLFSKLPYSNHSCIINFEQNPGTYNSNINLIKEKNWTTECAFLRTSNS